MADEVRVCATCELLASLPSEPEDGAKTERLKGEEVDAKPARLDGTI